MVLCVVVAFRYRFSNCRQDCEHFNIDCPEFPLAEEMKADLERHENMWSLFEEFNTELQTFAKEDWISFRLPQNSKLYNSCSLF